MRPTTCPHGDPTCPCQDGDPCHYEDYGDTKAMPSPLAHSELPNEGHGPDTLDGLRKEIEARAAEAGYLRKRIALQIDNRLKAEAERDRLRSAAQAFIEAIDRGNSSVPVQGYFDLREALRDDA